jgi:sarcosine oxidase subunit alpha
MATDQGKLSNINGLAVLADSLNTTIPQVGTTTFRPPYTPVTLGTLAGEARGDIFQPLRKTPIHEWHVKSGAYFEPVGLWRRPYTFPRPGETHEQAVHREVLNTRQNLGLLDASTLGKIIVKGPDAGKFLDMLYTGVMSTLPVGKCRYGLMCNEQGFLSDDGVVARINEDTWLCHTTSGGADRIHAWMEDWLQCEWWDWQVYTANVTEQYAQVAVVGPNARKLLQVLGGMMFPRKRCRSCNGSTAPSPVSRSGPIGSAFRANSATRSPSRPATVPPSGKHAWRREKLWAQCLTGPRRCT